MGCDKDSRDTDSRGFYETSDVDYRGPGAAPDCRNGLVRSVGGREANGKGNGKACGQGHPKLGEASGFRGQQVSRKEIQQTFQAAGAGAKSAGSRTHLRNSASARQRWFVRRDAKR